MLEALELTKRYGETLALNGVSLSVGQGEIFGLLGPNGAGKTTFVSIVSTLLPFDGGNVTVGGQDVRAAPRAVRSRIGLAPQDVGLYDPLSTVENLRFFGGLYGLHGSELAQRIDDAIAVAGLEEHRGKRVGTFSGGMKRRLSLAVALLHRPALLLLDEPTAGVDPQSRHHLLESIRAINRDWGTTVVYTTHYMEEAEELCDRVAIIDHGRIIRCDAVREMLAGFGATVLLFRAAASDRLTSRLQAEVAPVHLSCRDGLYQVGLHSLQESLPRILQIAEEERAALDDLRMTRPTLEQVFLSLTGRGLRD
jgi:ABC-2 type transport system ATP-binding protein